MVSVTAVVLAYGAEEWLGAAVESILASTGVDLDLVLVDNGCTTDAVKRVQDLEGVKVLTPSENLGYAGGCNYGAAEASSEYLAFVNSDAVVATDALAKLVAVASEPQVAIAMGSIRLGSDPELINSAGNPLHYVGLSWAGGCGEPATSYASRETVLAASGACFVIRRSLWEELRGFAEEYFAYCEDTELALRIRQRGMVCEYVPDAVVVHHYEFSRNDLKFYLLERNRLILVLTTYQARSLLVLAPMLVLTEALMVVAAVAGGWAGAKARGWRWLWSNRRWVRSRRRLVQGARTVPDRAIVPLMTSRFTPTNVPIPPGMGVFNAVTAAYWKVARGLL